MRAEHLLTLFGDRTAPDGVLVRDNFARWFRQSAIVDVQGRPLTVYHGTTAGAFRCFEPRYRKNEQLGFGIHFAVDREFAKRYATDPTVARRGKQPHVHETWLSAQRVLEAAALVKEGSAEFELAIKLAGRKLYIDRDEHGVRCAWLQNAIDLSSAPRAERIIRDAGFDGIRYESRIGSRGVYGATITATSTSFIVFEPTQVKSVHNSGAFRPDDPDCEDSTAYDYLLLQRAGAALKVAVDTPAKRVRQP